MCETDDDTQEHLFHCQKIRESLPHEVFDRGISYEDIFDSNCDTLLEVAKSLKEIVKIREDWSENNP